MLFTLEMHQTALIKNRPDLAALEKSFGPVFHIGGVGLYGIFQAEAPPAEGLALRVMLHGRKSPAGRGFTLTANPEYTVFTLQVEFPASRHDLEDFFAFAGMFANFINAKSFFYKGESMPPSLLNSLYGEARQENCATICALVQQEEACVVSGVRFPLWLPQNLCQRIMGLPADKADIFFSSYLADKQAADYYYAKPVFEMGEDGAVIGRYTLTEGVPSIIPKEPFVPYGPPPFGGAPVALWALALVEGSAVLGVVPYSALLAYIEERDRASFDDKHYLLRGLSRRRLLELIESAKAETAAL